MRIPAAIVLLLASGLTAGCYSRQPLQGTVPVPDTRVVAVVTDQGAATMGDMIGTGATEVEGIVRAASASEWTLNMVRVEHRDGRQVGWNREMVAFPAGTLGATQVVELDRTRSWLAAGAGVAGAFIIARIFGLQFGGDDEGRDRNGPAPPQMTGGSRR
jgi:hypothetical protein